MRIESKSSSLGMSSSVTFSWGKTELVKISFKFLLRRNAMIGTVGNRFRNVVSFCNICQCRTINTLFFAILDLDASIRLVICFFLQKCLFLVVRYCVWTESMVNSTVVLL